MNLLALANHHSYAIAAVLVFVVVGWVILRWRPGWVSVGALAVLAAALFVPPLYVGSAGHSGDALSGALASGKPTLLEVYSDL